MPSPAGLDETLALASALASKERLLALRALRAHPLSLSGLREAIGSKGHPSTLYRHIERLCDAGLVEKFYDSRGKALKYRLLAEQVTLHF